MNTPTQRAAANSKCCSALQVGDPVGGAVVFRPGNEVIAIEVLADSVAT
jgi:hypothetical protein